MKRRVSMFFVLLLAGVQCSVGAGDTRAALAQIRQIAKDESQSYERLVERASRIAREAYQDKEWGVVEEGLKSAGLEPVAVAGSGDAEFRCVLLPNACVTAGGSEMDLYLSFYVSHGRPQPTYSVPPDYTVLEATVGLSATLLASQEQVRKEQWFGKGTVIQEALSAWPVTNALPGFPVLETVDVSFGEIRDMAVGNGRQGYRLQLVLVKGKDDRQSSRRLECSAAVSDHRGKGRDPVGGWLSRDLSPPGAARTLAEDLRRVVKEKERSYHRLLCKATHIVRNAALGSEWSAVAQELDGQDLKPLDKRSWDCGTKHKYLVSDSAYTTERGQSMDLYVEFRTWRETSKTAPTREIVSEAYAGLSANTLTTYAQALSEARFGKDTAIHKALLHKDAEEAAKKSPFLNTVDVYYDVIVDRWQACNSWGFHVRPEFITGKGDASTSASLNLTIPSGLDPLERHGLTVLVKDFVPKDTLGDPFCHGGSFSGGSESPSGGQKTAFFLTRRGAPRWRKTEDEGPEPVAAYGLGDLKSLPPTTPAIRVENREVYDDDLSVLARFTDLRVLDLGKCDGITDSGLGHLEALKKLKSLTLSGELLSGTGFRHLRDLPALTNLRLYWSQRLTAEGVKAVAEMKQLTRLKLHWARALTDDQLAHLTKLTALRELHIWGSAKISDIGLRHVSMLPDLEGLTFSHARSITPSGIAHLIRLKNLQEISLGYMPLKDDAMLPLSRIESLEYVEMHGLEITDQAIQSLRDLTHLKRLYLHGCKGVTTEGVNKLKASLKADYVLE